MKRTTAPPSSPPNLSAVMDDTDKVRQFYEKRHCDGLEIQPPTSTPPTIASRRSMERASVTAWAAYAARRRGDPNDHRGAAQAPLPISSTSAGG